MQKLNKLVNISNNSGSALVTAIVFTIIFSIVGISSISLISRGNQLHSRDIEVIKSYWANEGFIRIALRYLTTVPVRPKNIENFTVKDENKGKFSINAITPTLSIVIGSRSNYTITSISPVDNLNNITNVKNITYDYITKYSYFQQGPLIKNGKPILWGGAVFHGNYHSNETIVLSDRMSDKVHVTGEATGSSNHKGDYPEPYNKGLSVINPYGNEAKEGDKDADDGDEINLAWFKEKLPNYRSVDPISTENLVPENNAFDNGWTIEKISSYNQYDSFKVVLSASYGVGKAYISGKKRHSDWKYLETKYVQNVLSDNDGIIKSNKPIKLQGTLKGQLSVVSTEDIIISDDILYDGVPEGTSPNLNDGNTLGIVSNKDIRISSSLCQNNTNDIFIYGSLIAKNGCLRGSPDVGDYYYYKGKKYYYWDKSGFNKIMMHDSLLVHRQDGTGVSGRGFQMHVYGDKRLMDNLLSPPGIPDIRSEDEEMRVHHNGNSENSLAFSFPINIGLWSNSVK